MHGIYFLESEPTPVLVNARLFNQSGTAIVASHEQTLVVAGLHISRSPEATGPAIRAYWSGHQNNAQLSISDSVIECGGDGTTVAVSVRTSETASGAPSSQAASWTARWAMPVS